MLVPRTTLYAFLTFAFCASLAAQQPTAAPPERDPQAVAALQRSLSVLKGSVAIQDVTLTGNATRIAGSDDESGTVSLKATSLQDSRMDLVFPSGVRSEIRNHAAIPSAVSLPPGVPASETRMPQPVGAWISSDGNLHAMAEHNTMTDPAWFFPALTLANLAASQTYSLSYVGEETHDGQSLLHISASEPFPGLANAPAQTSALLQHLSEMDIYFDPVTLLPAALDFSVHPDGNALIDIPVEIRFSEYQAVSGAKIPYHIQKYLNNVLVLDVQLSDGSINSGLAPSVFAIQ